MNKWFSSESFFKRVSPAQSDNGASVEETKKLYESGSVEELQNSLSSQLKKKEAKRNTLKNSLILTAVLTCLLAAASVFLLAKVGSLQGQNQNLSNEAAGLRAAIQSLESENKEIRSKIVLAEKEREDLKGKIDTLSRQKETLEQELRNNQTLVTDADEEKTYLEEILINKTKEIERLKKNAPAGTPITATPPAVASKDAEIKRLSEQNRILSNRIESLYKITNDKIAAINVAKITLDETITEARKNIDNEWSTVNLGSIQASQTAAKSEPNRLPKKEGHVLAINEQHGFVVVDLGKANGMGADSSLTLNQNGEAIATLVPLEIRDVMTACNIRDIKPGRKIAINDPVSIRK